MEFFGIAGPTAPPILSATVQRQGMDALRCKGGDSMERIAARPPGRNRPGMPASANLTVRSLVTIASLIAIPGVAVWSFTAPPPTPARRAPKPAAGSRSGGPFARGLFSGASAAPDVSKLFESSAAAETVLSSAPAEAAFSPAVGDSHVRRTAAVSPLKSPAFWTESPPPPTRSKPEPSHSGSAGQPGGAAPVVDEPNGVAVLVERDEHRLQPTGRRMTEPTRPQSPPPLVSDGAAAAARPEAMNSEQFSALEERLKALGATHYRLETWGAQGELFRFRAMMSLSSRSNHNRYFEATDRDAMRSVERVIEQVERWRAGQTERDQ